MPQESLPLSVTKSELIAQWCERLGHAFGRNVKDTLVRIWQERLAVFTEQVLRAAFYHIEGHDDKFPAVSRCIEVCGIVAPDRKSPFYPEGVDNRGVKCWIGENGEYLYAANDCPEGRAFLQKLREVARRLTFVGK